MFLSARLSVLLAFLLVVSVDAQYRRRRQRTRTLAPAVSAGNYVEESYPPQPHSFNYDVTDEYGNQRYHREEGDGSGRVTGSYGYTDAAGIYRYVDYVADENGYRATIRSNEPGLDNPPPADTTYDLSPPPADAYAARPARTRRNYNKA
ncbi:cuticle protein 10.9-like [Brevipalpus obovatus]|uniref:cuticle protein 10.9-like n=1 Tax=Brevipalpus obovatus TaxID=246614 RepID=UPI003D9EE55E